MRPLTHAPQLSQVLKGRRKALKLTQAALASKLALTQNRLSQIEADPTGLTLDRLLDLLSALGLELVIRNRRAAAKGDW